MRRPSYLRDASTFAAAFLALLVALLVAGRTAFLQDPGTFWHVAAGERIAATGRVLREDPFGFATYGRPWIPMQWLAEVGMAALHRVGGMDALVVASATLLAVVYASLARHLARRGCRPLLVVALVTLVLAASSHHFIARPHLFTILFVGWTYASLLDWEDTPSRGRGALLTLPPAFVLWTNLHGGVAGGVAMVVLATAGFLVVPLLRMGVRATSTSRRDALTIIAVAAACVGAVFVSPFGAALPRTWLTLSSSRVLPLLIKEHAPPSFTSPGDLVVVLLAALYVALLAGVPWRLQRVTYFLPLAWLALSMRSVRHAPLFALVAALALPVVMRDCGWMRRRFEARPDSPFALHAPSAHLAPWPALALAPALALVLSLALQMRQVKAPLLGRGWAEPDASVAPYDVLPALEAAALRAPEGSGILNEMGHGGFLILYVPRLRVFIDDRWEVHGDATLLRYARASDGDPAALDLWAQSLGIHLALAPAASPLEQHLATSAGWSRLAQGASASLFERRPTEP